METVNITVAVLRRYNLGNYEHVEGRIEISLPPCAEADVDRKIAETQARILRHLTPQALTGAQVVPEAQSTPPPPPAPSPPPVADLKELRHRITRAVSVDTTLQSKVIAMLAEAGLARLKDAPEDLLRKIAAEVGA